MIAKPSLPIFAKGGGPSNKPFAKGGSDRMLGKGDRTTTRPSDAANTQAAGVTGHKTPGKNLKQPTGGSRTPSDRSLAVAAKPGRTAPAPTKGR